ncbi:MAG: cupin-like domain-containing protein [Alphaproteobacteria bacterium]|nr:cupin-like domain-containing protein [Alphaproteobacteria bacterium]MBV9370113.1 cupin-like domain-containing protein [Alphaproteobacteria bacterium]MBV9901453.1 cupin-like domain-containing protein [Alphaproteobacteria bacterium]
MDAARFRDEIVPLGRPAVLRGLVGEWPAVARGAASPRAMADYLAAFDRGAPVEGFIAPPEAGGRFFYSDDLSGFNFERRKGRVRDIAAHLAGQAPGASAPAIYVGSAPIPDCLPGFERENALALLGGRDVVPRIWIGNATLVAPHFDLSDNIACVVAGRRRFLLFPPEQAANLYVGPLDHTMAGQPASMVDVRTPDLDRHPRYREALAAGETAALEPGDALYIPSPWWHGVEAAGPLNVLVNYWWDDAPPGAGSPFEAMVHGIYAFAGQSEARRAAWRAMYDHFVFRRDGDPAAHLPGDRRGILGAPTPQLHERIRAFLLTMLGRR